MPRQATIVTDIGYGDAGKGTLTDYLVRQAKSAVVVRYNGGPQAAHNVVTPHGRHHTFAQFGSGSFVPGVRTHLSRHMLLNPLNMFREADHLAAVGVTDAWERLSVDQDAVIILPWHQAANRLREIARGNGRHGSCGQGVGEAKADLLYHPETALRVRDLLQPLSLASRLADCQAAKYERLQTELDIPDSPTAQELWRVLTDRSLLPWLCEQFQEWIERTKIVDGSYLQQLALTHEQLVFEGAQGVLLDESHGFYPYTTWSDTTPANAEQLLDEIGYDDPVTKLGVMRAYTTRHGAGPFLTEDPSLAQPLREQHNDTGEWQGNFRYGHLDLVAHRYAVDACQGFDQLAITGVDRMAKLPVWQYCSSYQAKQLPTDAANYLWHDTSSQITGLKPGPVTPACDYQARLTQLLANCSPNNQPVSAPSGNPDAQERELLSIIEQHLGSPITIVSHGPTAADKRALALR